MNYFLRNFPSPFFFDQQEGGILPSAADNCEHLQIQLHRDYVDLLWRASRHKFGAQSTLWLGRSPMDNKMGATEEEQLCKATKEEKNKKDKDNEDCEQREEKEVGGSQQKQLDWLLAQLDLAAPPSAFGANALAQTAVHRFHGGPDWPLTAFENNRAEGSCPEHWLLSSRRKGQRHHQKQKTGKKEEDPFVWSKPCAASGANGNGNAPPLGLLGLGLDCIFSVLRELNAREPELCARALHSLLRLLQNVGPGSLVAGGQQQQSAQMVGRMHALLRELRREGGASVSAAANACMMSLAVAAGKPEFICATIVALLCEPKRHLPHNQISADCSPLPRNVLELAQSARHLLLGRPPGSTSCWLSAGPLEHHPLVCEFDVIYTGSALLLDECDGGQGGRAAEGAQGCLVSDGAFVYLLTVYGLLKMGTGLAETRAGEVLTCNEQLRFAEGSALFLSNESLYLRRRHSPRLWVLDRESLREIGEILLPASAGFSQHSGQQQLFADGRQFWQASLDDQWLLSCTPLDDSFAPQQSMEQQQPQSTNGGQQQQSGRQTAAGAGVRLMDIEFCAFGELDGIQQRLLQSIPTGIRGITADLQLGPGVGFLLTRTGQVFFAGPDASSGFGLYFTGGSSTKADNDPLFCWSPLSLPEPMVAMALEPTSRTLAMRSGAGNLWLLGPKAGTPAKQQQKQQQRSPRQTPKKGEDKGSGTRGGQVRRIRVANKRKCVSMSLASVGGGCLAYALDNGRCFLLGRHVLLAANGANPAQGSGGRPSASAHQLGGSALPVPGMDQMPPVAQLALGKTHLVFVGKNGAVYATGLNNQNQCGRMVAGSSSRAGTTAAEADQLVTAGALPSSRPSAALSPPQQQCSAITTSRQQSSVNSSSCSLLSSSAASGCFPFSQHIFLDDLAALCLRCGQCSVGGPKCSQGIAQTAKGSLCACARTGPSCCLRCGLCRHCAEKEEENGGGFGQLRRLSVASPRAVRLQQQQQTQGKRQQQQRLLGAIAPLARDELVDAEQQEQQQQRNKRNDRDQNQTESAASTAGLQQKVAEQPPMPPSVAVASIPAAVSTASTTRIFPPERVVLQQQPMIKVAAVSVGHFHTVVLSADNQVYTFGANTHGQLGTGDTAARPGAHRLALPANVHVVQAVAGANHTVLRTLDGRLITFGAYKAGQLGRRRLPSPADGTGANHQHQQQQQQHWFAEPGFVPGFGQAYGRLASWMGAQGDRTLVQVQRQLLSRAELAEATLTANGDCLLLVLPSATAGRPTASVIGASGRSKGYLLINRRGGKTGTTGIEQQQPPFRHFQWGTEGGGKAEEEEIGRVLANCSFCLDPLHGDLLWAYQPRRMCVLALLCCSSPSPLSSSNTKAAAAANGGAAGEQNEPLFLRQHRQLLLRTTELMVPSAGCGYCGAQQAGAEDNNNMAVPGGSNGGDAAGGPNGDDRSGSSSGGGTAAEGGGSPVRYSDCQLGLFLLASLYSLAIAATAGIDGKWAAGAQAKLAKSADEEEERMAAAAGKTTGAAQQRPLLMRDCRAVNRFENFGGGWGYSAHCVEAVQFKTSRPIDFCGVGLFGGRGEYSARLKLYRVIDEPEQLFEPTEAGERECLELLAETDEVLYECGQRETAVLRLERPIRVPGRHWHVLWVQINGPSSDCGAGGQPVVRTAAATGTKGEREDEDCFVEFQFRPSALSNNGTNVEVGQIPELYYFLPELDYEQEGQREEEAGLLENEQRTAGPTAQQVYQQQGRRRRKTTTSEGAAGLGAPPRWIISPGAIFADVRPQATADLLHITGWALDQGGAFAGQLDDGEEEEVGLLDCEWAWRQERAALVAVLATRLVRLFLCQQHRQQRRPIGITAGRQPQQQLLALHRLLKGILQRPVVNQDSVATFLLAEAVSAYSACAPMFAPTAAILRARLVPLIGARPSAVASASWWLLALLSAAERIEEEAEQGEMGGEGAEGLLALIGLEQSTADEKGRGGGSQRRGEQGKSANDAAVDWAGEEQGEQQQAEGRNVPECSPIDFAQFLFELAFAELSDEGGDQHSGGTPPFDEFAGRNDNANLLLLRRLNSSAQRLLLALARRLVFRCLSSARDAPSSDDEQMPLQTPSRFRHISAHPQWEVGSGPESWDALAFRVDRDGILLRGVGLFSGNSPPAAGGQQPPSFELELMQSQPGMAEDWRPLERMDSVQLDSFPTQTAIFSRPWALKAGQTYGIRVRFSGPGKTLFGEGGHSWVDLSLRDGGHQQQQKGGGGGRLHFVPCGISRNGTTVARGQFPFLLYSIRLMEQQRQKGQNEEGKGASGEQPVQQRRGAAKDCAAPQLFLHLLRLLVQRLGHRMVRRSGTTGPLPALFRPGEQLLCQKLLALAGLMAAQQSQSSGLLFAYQLVTVLDEAIPILAHVNSAERREDEEDEFRQQVSSMSSEENGNDGSRPNVVIPAAPSAAALHQLPPAPLCLESPHPYPAGQLLIFRLNFPPSAAQFLSVRFDPLCRTAQPTDALWLYCAKEERGGDQGTKNGANCKAGVTKETTTMFPVAKFSERDWPRGHLTVPGHTLWLLFETGANAENLQPSAESAFGFRCSVEPIAPMEPISSRFTPNQLLERHFVWCLASACQRLATASGGGPEEEESERRAAKQLLNRHGLMARRGIRFGSQQKQPGGAADVLPTLGDLLMDQWEREGEGGGGEEHKKKKRREKEWHLPFVEQFAERSTDGNGGLTPTMLADALCFQPYVDLRLSRLQVQPEQANQGRPMEFILLARDQHDREVVPVEGTEVLVLLRGNNSSRQSAAAAHSSTALVGQQATVADDEEEQWTSRMRSAQLKVPFRPVPIGHALHQCLSTLPAFSGWSLEELRFAFVSGGRASGGGERIWLSKNQSKTHFCAVWIPQRVGTFSVQCLVDGLPLMKQPSELEVIPQQQRDGEGPQQHQQQRDTQEDLLEPPFSAAYSFRQNVPQLKMATATAAHVGGLRRAHFPRTSPFGAVRVRAHPSLSARPTGTVRRGTWLDFVEVVRNGDGVWLRLGGQGQQQRQPVNSRGDNGNEGEAWVLQMNAHLQTEFLQIAPPSNGNFLPALETTTPGTAAEAGAAMSAANVPQQQTISISDSPKLARGPLSGKQKQNELSPSGLSSPPPPLAIGPALLEAFRWTFCAFCWHSSPNGESASCCSMEELMDTADWLAAQRSTFAGCLWEMEGGSSSSQRQPGQWPPAVRKAMASWREFSLALWATVVQKQQPAGDTPTSGRQGPTEADEAENTGNTTEASSLNNTARCDLCGGTFPRPIGQHMRKRHPGCGRPSLSCGYNSAGQWSTGWSGRCGEGGQGKEVWYLLCVHCRESHLQKHSTTRATGASDDDSKSNGLGDGNSMPMPLAERLKRNAQFLLELNRESPLATARGGVGPPVLAMDPYPEAGKIGRPKAVATATRERRGGQSPPAAGISKWHSSDPGESSPAMAKAGDRQQVAQRNYQQKICDEQDGFGHLFSVSASARLAAPLDGRQQTKKQAGNGNGSISVADVLAFVTEEDHDLDSLRTMFRRSLLKAVSLAFAFRLWTWLLKMASSEQSVLDAVWHFLAAFLPPSASSSPSAPAAMAAQQQSLLPHPAHLCLLAGAQPNAQMIREFHSLLQHLAMVFHSPDVVEPRLKCLCFRAWTFQLTGHEQALLPTIRSLLSAVGNVLGASSTAETGAMAQLSATGSMGSSGTVTMRKCSSQSVASGTKGNGDGAASGGRGHATQMDDLSELVRLEASSRAQLLACLLDGSCETFWESGEEDRARERRLAVRWETGGGQQPMMAALFVDNARDEGYRVGRVLARGRTEQGNKGEQQRKSGTILLDTQVDKGHTGWIKFGVAEMAGGAGGVNISIWGDELGSRLRQFRLFGLADSSQSTVHHQQQQQSSSGILLRPSSSHQLLFGGSGAQGDAFALFQSLATQVFGGEELGEDGNGILREQVLDLLFSRSQLQPLQSFVGSQVFSAVEREVASLRDRRKRHFSYATALLQMLVRMCSAADPASFAPDGRLLAVLSQLWLFAPQSVQGQALEATQKLLAHCRPDTVDVDLLSEHLLALVAKGTTLQVKQRRPRGAGPAERHTVRTHLADVPPAEWALDRPVGPDSVRLAIDLLRRPPLSNELAAQMRAQVGARIMRFCGHLRDSLARGQSAEDCIRSAHFWLAVAALVSMDGPHWLEQAPGYKELKSEQNRSRDPLCENHDDGRTRAQLRCQSCALSLCRDCFAVLHLSRRSQGHRARLVGSALATPVPRVDFHAGCHRLRLGAQLLLLVNPDPVAPAGLVELLLMPAAGDGQQELERRKSSRTPLSSSSSLASLRKVSQEMVAAGSRLMPSTGSVSSQIDNGNQQTMLMAIGVGEAEERMEECREEEEEEEGGETEEASERNQSSSQQQDALLAEGKCRFCGTQLGPEQRLFRGCCDQDECRHKETLACARTLPCGHWCSGIRAESVCPPCLLCQNQCGITTAAVGCHQDADDLCAICLAERLGESPSIVLRCGHVFHWECVRTGLEKRWPGPRISFRFMQCPLCKVRIEHEALDDLLAPLRELERDVAQKARLRLDYEGGSGGGTSCSNMSDSTLLETALSRFVYVQCSHCTKSYFGGDARCQLDWEQAVQQQREGDRQPAFDPAELVCGSCAARLSGGTLPGGGLCGRHGADLLEFKCRFCCSVAMYFCFGTTHFCAACHGDFPRLITLPRANLPKCPAGPRAQPLAEGEPCPLGVAHPPTGEEFALGCGICRNLRTF